MNDKYSLSMIKIKYIYTAFPNQNVYDVSYVTQMVTQCGTYPVVKYYEEGNVISWNDNCVYIAVTPLILCNHYY